MYFKIIRVHAGAKNYRYLRLVENFRRNGKVRQRVLLSLGNLDTLDAGKIAGLGTYLFELGQKQLIPLEPHDNQAQQKKTDTPYIGVHRKSPGGEQDTGNLKLQGLTGHFPKLGVLCSSQPAVPKVSPAQKIDLRDVLNGALLKKSVVFSDLTEQQCAALTRVGVEHGVGSGQFLYVEGEFLEYIYFIMEGRFKLLTHSPSGRDFIVGFRGPGDIIGNLHLSSSNPHPCSAQALTETKILAITKDDFLSFLAGQPELGLKILTRLLTCVGVNLIASLRRLTDLVAEKADYRLAYTLFNLSSEPNLTVNITREELAQMAGTTRETAVRFISRLEEMHMVRSLRRKITILDRTNLRLFMGDLVRE